jgi:two-component system LytT family response regulator
MRKLNKIGVLDDERIAVDGLVYQLKKLVDGVDVQGFMYAQPFVEWCKECKPGLVFLDMEMPGALGLDVAKEIKPFVGNIVFVTAHSHYSLDAFETAVDYILKPVIKSRLQQCLEKIAALDPVPVFEDLRVKLPVKGSYEWVKESTIIMLVGQRNYTNVVLENGESHLVARTLKSFSEGLSERFWRVHKSIIVRSDAVLNIQWGTKPKLTLSNKQIVDASKARLDELGVKP